MWIVTRIGFFNIIQYPEDKTADLLTIKARSKEDLENFKNLSATFRDKITGGVEESSEADYRFRLKVTRREAAKAIASLVEEIDYAKTKPVISEDFPERTRIYFNVWDTLGQIQEIDAAKERLHSPS